MYKHTHGFNIGTFLISLLLGSSDVTPVFVLQGKDVVLEVKEAQLNTHTDVFWKFNKSYNIVKFARSGEPFIFKRYQGKVTLLVKNHSLLLRNLNESDSGYYTAVLTGEQDQMAAEYKVIVQGRFLIFFSIIIFFLIENITLFFKACFC